MQPCEEAGVDPLDWYRDHVDEAYGDDIEADRDNVMVMMILSISLVTNRQLCDQSLGIWSSTRPNTKLGTIALFYLGKALVIHFSKEPSFTLIKHTPQLKAHAATFLFNHLARNA